MESMERNEKLAYQLMWCTEHDDEWPSVRKVPFVELVRFVQYLMFQIDLFAFEEEERATNTKEKTGTSPSTGSTQL